MDYLEEAKTALSKSRKGGPAIVAQAHALDSIAASLLHIAQNMNTKPTVSDDQIELVVRRLMDNAKTPTVKSKKGAK